MALRLVDGTYEEVLDDSIQISNALTAGGGPLYPPDKWFEDPKLSRPTPITITADGQIYGHIAPWNVSHIGMPPGTKPPKSASNYAYFRTGILKTESGRDVPVGQLTLAGGHAPLSAGAGEAVKHYDDTSSSVADLVCGEDAHGIWVSGGLRPGVTDEQIRALRASAPSGDWRPIDGSLELVAVCQVNTPGFPVARAMVASGDVSALVAAGAAEMYQLQQESLVLRALQSVAQRVANLESDVEAIAASVQAPTTTLPPKQKQRLVVESEDGHETDVTADEIEFETEDGNVIVAAAPAAGPNVLRVRYDKDKNVLVVADLKDSINTSYDKVDTSDVKNAGLGIDTQSKRMPTADLREQGYMPDAGSGNVGMRTEDQGPNGSRMDGDGDFDGDRDPSLPRVHSTSSGFAVTHHDEFNHTIDKCHSGCINPAHSSKTDADEGGITAAATKGKASKGAPDDPDDGEKFSRDDNDDSVGTDADSGADVTNDTKGGAERDMRAERLANARKSKVKLEMTKYKSKQKNAKIA